MYELALFAGAGGGILGGKLCGFTCVGAVEIEKYPREVLKQRQRDGILPRFPIWDDVTTFRIDNPECRGYIKKLKEVSEQLIVTGGFPCQDISAAGKGAGIKQNTRSGLWFEMARIIDEIRPSKVLVENSPVLTSRGLGVVLGDLAEMGYNAKWGVLGANIIGARHLRERIWIVADNTCEAMEKQKMVQSTFSYGKFGRIASYETKGIWESGWKNNEPSMVGTSYGLADWVDRSKAIGNGQVPAVVKAAWEILNN